MSRLLSLFILALILPPLLSSPARGASILGEEAENFFKERVNFGGFVENTSGLSISHGDRHFNTSNRFIMNRFTVQPEFNFDFAETYKLFLSWRFVAEPRYSAESKSREATVSPASSGDPLPVDFYSEYKGVPWEAVLDIQPTDRLTLRWGRQFISWGETDGFRLLDVINPQDVTFSPPAAPNLFDLDELRIPSWGLRTLYTVRPVSNTIFEFFALPGGLDKAEQRVDEVMGSNDTADEIIQYGRWSSHPETRLVVAGRSGFGNLFADPFVCPSLTTDVTCAVIPTVTRQLPDAGDSWKIGSRITHNVGKLNLGLGYIWGFNPQGSDMVFKRIGDPFPIPCPFPPFDPDDCTGVRVRLINDRTHIFAGHFNYPVEDIGRIPVNTAIRGELAFYPDKPYNISNFPGSTLAGTTLKAGPDPEHPDGVVEKNTLRYSLGFDRSTLIPFLQDDPWRAFRLSFQIFQSIIPDHEDGIRVFSTAEKIRRVSTVLTFRASTGYRGDTILPDIFVAYDPAGYWAANPAVSYAPPWNEKIRFTLTAALYGGHNKFGSLGLFSEKDSVFLKMRYQY